MSAVRIHTVDALGSVALSGTASTTIPVPQGTQQLIIRVSCEYAAVAATSGITVGLQTSVDGTTFVSANETAAELQPAAGVLGSEVIIIPLGNSPFIADHPSFLNSVKVTLTNTDATNAATYAISHQALNGQV